MNKILLTGFQQKQHIKALFEMYGKKVTFLTSKSSIKIIRRIEYLKQIHRCDCLYFVGGVDGDNLLLKAASRMGKIIVIHWIGTDVLNLLNNSSFKDTYPKKTIHLSGSQLLHDELKTKGISSYVVPIVPINMDLSISKMPENHAALVYLPTGKEMFYGADLVKRLAEVHKDVVFHIVANDNYKELNLPNVIFHGNLTLEEMSELYDTISILIRLPKHDGLSLMVIEALIKGKTVLYNYKHEYTVNPLSMSFEEVDKAFSYIILNKPTIDVEASNFTKNYYSVNSIIKKYIDAGIC